MNGKTLVAQPYGVMVAALMKPMGSFGADLLHACVGICGEAAELSSATNIEGVVEEVGDVLFYVEAAYITIGGRPAPGTIRLHPDDPVARQTLGSLPLALTTVAGDLLDVAKKCWVYGKPIDMDDFRERLLRLETLLDTLLQLVGMRLADVLSANQAKLGQRYPDQVYTDRAAIVRADKA